MRSRLLLGNEAVAQGARDAGSGGGIARKAIRGKLTGDLPPTGELTPDTVARALGQPRTGSPAPVDDLVGRPPQLLRGCR